MNTSQSHYCINYRPCMSVAIIDIFASYCKASSVVNLCMRTGRKPDSGFQPLIITFNGMGRSVHVPEITRTSNVHRCFPGHHAIRRGRFRHSQSSRSYNRAASGVHFPHAVSSNALSLSHRQCELLHNSNKSSFGS
jgi:hypothetical protein